MKSPPRQRVTFREKVSLLEAQVAQLHATVTTLVTLAGPDKVREAARDAIVKKAESDNAALIQALESAVKAGKLADSDVVTLDSFVLGAEYDPDGKEMPPGRVALVMARVPDAVRQEFLGRGAGALQLDAGHVFHVDVILNPA